MIVIEKPSILSDKGKARLRAQISIDGNLCEVWFEVDSKYEPYLCYERGDAFVVAILNYAMRYGHDIESKAPIGEDLYYQLSGDLIEALSCNSKILYKTKLIAEIDSSTLPNAGAVGTGISCGVDSFHAIALESQTTFPKHKLTHLAFNNVGSHGEGAKAQKLFTERKALAKKFCEEYHFEYIEGDSNLQDVIPQNHLQTHTYSSMFSVFALQKLYSVYYYASSGHPYNHFSLTDSEKYDAANYELLTLKNLSTHSLLIYSEGGEKNRFAKIKDVVQYVPSYNYLNVCLVRSKNCGTCEKCVRTLIALDALGKLDEYANVFDIDYYRSHLPFYYKKLVVGTLEKNDMYAGVYEHLKHKISVVSKILGFVRYLIICMRRKLSRLIPTSIKRRIKKK